VSKSVAATLHPGADFREVGAVFEVRDITINTRLLYRRVMNEASRCGAVFALAADVKSIEGQVAEVEFETGQRASIRSKLFVYATGHKTKQLIVDLLGKTVPLRYWKSHMLLTRRITDRGIFHVDAGEAAIMHHRDISIVNLNEDAVPCESPDYSIDQPAVDSVWRALLRLFPGWHGQECKPVSCIKCDLEKDKSRTRSVDVSIFEPSPGHICILPGKMTEAPFLTDQLVRIAHERLDDAQISLRPMDLLRNAGSERHAAHEY
jgi:hypothetical protein